MESHHPTSRTGAEDESVTALLRATGIHKAFGRRSVLADIDLTVHAGEAVAVVGANGAGKTTLLRICAGLLNPDQGELLRSGRVGYCPQKPGLVDLLTARPTLVSNTGGR